jgi:hypothetical protein
VWVLTGDKEETAINIGYACMLLNKNMHHMNINSSTAAGVRLQLQEAVEELGLLEDEEQYEDEEEDEDDDDRISLTDDTIRTMLRQQRHAAKSSRETREQQPGQKYGNDDHGDNEPVETRENLPDLTPRDSTKQTSRESGVSSGEEEDAFDDRATDTYISGSSGSSAYRTARQQHSSGGSGSSGERNNTRKQFTSVQDSMVSAASRATACAGQAEQQQQWDGQQLSLVISGDALYFALEQHLDDNAVGVETDAEDGDDAYEVGMLSVSQVPRKALPGSPAAKTLGSPTRRSRVNSRRRFRR